ncbi:EF-hand domain-containing protein [Rhodoferax sp. 4810]|uniref:EF-hand domain-containing protein n=1 Tax=Thiospirillum jenense TaxID=1653858 RepID=A0A839HF55_9GAMM|nr:EF-hand domain-containing protein [Thiospirillum jenense]MBB1077612.1 EF-hand domain-containing protein [Rhodoferax jenense]MBB1127291.1 EF-hand domain-containing protein [Thiospirillum jenense]
MRHTALRPLTICTACLISSMSVAQPPAPTDAATAPRLTPTEAFMKALDVNKDQQVSLDEAKSVQLPRFKETDADGSGNISIDEARNAFTKQVPAEMLTQMRERGMPDPGETFVKNLDKNNDNAIDLNEFERPAVDSFQRMDTNKDGVATAEEAAAFFEQMQQQMQERMRQIQQQMQEQMTPPAGDAPAAIVPNAPMPQPAPPAAQ